MNRTAPPPPTQVKRAGPPPPPPKIAKKVPSRIQVTNQQPQQALSDPQPQLPPQIQAKIKQPDFKERQQTKEAYPQAMREGSTKNIPLDPILDDKRQAIKKEQQNIPELIDQMTEDNPSTNNFQGELSLQTINTNSVKIEPVETPTRVPPVPPKKMMNSSQGKASIPGIRKPMNMPKPPPPIIRTIPTNQSEQQENKILISGSQQAKDSNTLRYEEDTNTIGQAQSAEQKADKAKIDSINKQQQKLMTPLKKQENSQEQGAQVKKISKPLPPPGLATKITNRVPPKAKIEPNKQKIIQKQIEQKIQPEKTENKQGTEELTESKVQQLQKIKEKQKPPSLNTIQNMKNVDDIGLIPQSAKIQPTRTQPNKSELSSEQSKYNLTPKYTNLKNKLKDFSIRKEKMLESSQSDSEINSQTYSEMHQNKNKIAINHNAQSEYDKPVNSTPVPRDQEIQYANVNFNVNGRNNGGVMVNSFSEDTQLLVTQGNIIKMNRNSLDQLNQLQRNASEQIYPQHQKQQQAQQYSVSRMSKIKSSTGQKSRQKTNKNQDVFSKKAIQQQGQVDHGVRQNDKQVNLNQIHAENASQVNEIPGQGSQEEFKQKANQYQYSQPIKQVEDEQMNSKTQPQEVVFVPPPKKIAPRAPPATKIKDKRIPPPQPIVQAELHHQQQLAPSQSLEENIKKQTEGYHKQSEVLQIEQMLEQFNKKKQQYLKNAQQLSQACSINREQEYKQVAVINELLLRLEQQNIKLKSILLNS